MINQLNSIEFMANMELHHHDIAKCSRFTLVIRTKSNVKPLKLPFERLPKNIPDSDKTTYKPHNYQQCNIIFDSLKPQNRQPMYDGKNDSNYRESTEVALR